jgi:hypothetical protein
MLTTRRAASGAPPVVRRAARHPSSGERLTTVPAQAVGGRAGELADLGQDPELTEAGHPATGVPPAASHQVY